MRTTGFGLFVCIAVFAFSCQSTGKREAPGVRPLASGQAISRLIERLAAKDYDERDRVIDEIIEIDRPAVPYLLEALGSESLDVRASAAWLLAKIGHITDPQPLIAVLDDEDVYVRENACLALANCPEKAVVEALTEALMDKEGLVRAAAAESLGYVSEAIDEEAVRALLEALKDDDWDVRICTAWAFGEIRDSVAVKPLIEVMKTDENWRIRETAAESLGWILDPAAVPALIECVKKEKNWNIRLCAIWSLGHIADESAFPVLIESLKDDNWRISAKAAKSLRKMTGKDFGTDHNKWLEWYRTQR